jgi:hypothetical protein
MLHRAAIVVQILAHFVNRPTLTDRNRKSPDGWTVIGAHMDLSQPTIRYLSAHLDEMSPSARVTSRHITNLNPLCLDLIMMASRSQNTRPTPTEVPTWAKLLPPDSLPSRDTLVDLQKALEWLDDQIHSILSPPWNSLFQVTHSQTGKGTILHLEKWSSTHLFTHSTGNGPTNTWIMAVMKGTPRMAIIRHSKGTSPEDRKLPHHRDVTPLDQNVMIYSGDTPGMHTIMTGEDTTIIIAWLGSDPRLSDPEQGQKIPVSNQDGSTPPVTPPGVPHGPAGELCDTKKDEANKYHTGATHNLSLVPDYVGTGRSVLHRRRGNKGDGHVIAGRLVPPEEMQERMALGGTARRNVHLFTTHWIKKMYHGHLGVVPGPWHSWTHGTLPALTRPSQPAMPEGNARYRSDLLVLGAPPGIVCTHPDALEPD